MKDRRVKDLMVKFGAPDSQSLKTLIEQVIHEVETEIWQKVEARSIDNDLRLCIEGSDLIETVCCLDMIAQETGRRVTMHKFEIIREYPHKDVKDLSLP